MVPSRDTPFEAVWAEVIKLLEGKIQSKDNAMAVPMALHL